MGIFGLIWNQIIVCSTFTERNYFVWASDANMCGKSDDYLMNLPDIPLTSAEAAQYKIDCAPSTGYLKKIKPMIFHQNWENKEVFRKKLVWVRPGNAIFIVTLLKNILKLSRCDFDYIAALKVSTWNSPIFSLELISFRQGINWIVNSNAWNYLNCS